MKNIKYYIFTVLIACVFSSCEDYLTVLPENNQSSFEYWETKEEVEAVLAAGYVELRSSAEALFLWGEARGNGLEFDREGSDLQKAARKVRGMDILPNNSLAKWANMYKVISMANSVIKYAPGVVEKDDSFNENVMKSFLSEAYFLRSLAYFYLVRTFGDVPFVTSPYVDDSAPYTIAKTDGTIILRSCLNDLEGSLAAAKEFFPETNNAEPINTKGRATRWAVHSLLADIYLWLGYYDQCITNCNAVFNSKRVGLIIGSYWFTNFYPGNSNESIFEIQYNKLLNQTNSFLSWFSTDSYYKISEYGKILFSSSDSDVRALKATYDDSDKIWKYIGIDADNARSGSTQNDQNYIIYRLADIYLMKAEAYIMKGGIENYQEAAILINQVRNRAGLDNILASADQLIMVTRLLEERQREFLGEGKNWFDLLRLGLRSIEGTNTNVDLNNLFVEQSIKGVSVARQTLARAVLADYNAWYLPIHSDEMKANPLLTQNDYYKKFSNR